MRIGGSGAAAAAALALAGCYSSGVLLVRGVVRGQDRVRAEPLGGAAVQCRDARDAPPRYARATTGEDGAYLLEYRYEGTWFPWLKPKGGDPWLEFSAPGWEPRLVRLRGEREDGVVRGERGRFRQLDVTLVPRAPGPATR